MSIRTLFLNSHIAATDDAELLVVEDVEAVVLVV